jgi:riboflavin kinase/FMN adenylyltransferase
MGGCVLTIGKFEGIHLGHRALLCEVRDRAKAAGLTSVAVVFEPHPFKFLHDSNYAPIFTRPERDQLIREIGIDKIVTFEFTADFAAMSAADFCREIFEGLQAREVVVGENYRFGRNREGSAETMQAYGKVCTLSSVGDISTSKIREFLIKSEMENAARLLGFPFFVEGVVTEGRKLGRVLGFPTLNIYPPADKFLPQNGVYETQTIIGGKSFRGLTNIGTRPTVSENEGRVSVETHIPALSGELYGTNIKVEFTRFIRPERKFSSAEELTAQICKDMEEIL